MSQDWIFMAWLRYIVKHCLQKRKKETSHPVFFMSKLSKQTVHKRRNKHGQTNIWESTLYYWPSENCKSRPQLSSVLSIFKHRRKNIAYVDDEGVWERYFFNFYCFFVDFKSYTLVPLISSSPQIHPLPLEPPSPQQNQI